MTFLSQNPAGRFSNGQTCITVKSDENGFASPGPFKVGAPGLYRVMAGCPECLTTRLVNVTVMTEAEFEDFVTGNDLKRVIDRRAAREAAARRRRDELARKRAEAEAAKKAAAAPKTGG